MVELKKKLVKVGGSFGFIVPKTLIDCKVLNEGDEFLITIEKAETFKKEARTNKANMPLFLGLVRALETSPFSFQDQRGVALATSL